MQRSLNVKTMKKTIAVVLVAIMALSCLIIPTSAGVKSSTPTIMMHGQGAYIYDENGKQVYAVSIPDGYIGNLVNECLPLLKTAILTNDYSEWSQKIVDAITEIYDGMRLDGDGNPRYGTHIGGFRWSDELLAEKAAQAPNFGIYTFETSVDWRLDPFENAAVLNETIERIKAATGFEKINIVVRCQGVATLACYLKEYGSDSLANICLYGVGSDGLEIMSALFSGNITTTGDSLAGYYNDMHSYVEGIGDAVLIELLDALVAAMQANYGLDIAVTSLQPIIIKLYKEVVYKCVLMSYGTMPGMWATISYDCYDKAKAGIFKGVEEEYAGLIEKIDRYHNEIASDMGKIFKDAEAAGVHVSIISKYCDTEFIPLADSNNLGDNTVFVSNSSFGATTATFDSTLSRLYLAKAEKKGNTKYISPDKRIDASTCLFPDTTWFVENSQHNHFAWSIEDLVMMILDSNGEMTVWTNANYPQFLHLEDNVNWGDLVPQTAENAAPDRENPHTLSNICNSFIRLVKALVAYLKTLNK